MATAKVRFKIKIILMNKTDMNFFCRSNDEQATCKGKTWSRLLGNSYTTRVIASGGWFKSHLSSRTQYVEEDNVEHILLETVC